MFSFFKNSFFGIISVASRLLSSFFLNKMVALYFGPAGLVQLAHFQNLVTFITLVPNDGINRGVIKYLADTNKQSPIFQSYFTTGFYLTITLFLSISLLLFSARSYFLLYFPPQLSWLSLFAGGTLLLVLQGFFNAVLMAQQKTGKLILTNVFSALAVVGYVIFAAGNLPIASFLIGYLFVLGIIGLSTMPFSWQGLPKKTLFKLPVSGEAWQYLSKFILMAASVLLFSKGLEYYIRDYLIQHFSVEQTGLWQGVVRVSDSYTALYTAVLAYAFYPKVAALLVKEPELKLFVRRSFVILVPTVMAGLVFVYFTRHSIFYLLLSSRFVAAQEFLPYQLAGDFFKLISWLLANVLVAQAKFKIILLFEAISALAYLGFFYLFTGKYDLAGTPMAHCAHYLLFFGLNLFYFRKLFTV